MNIREYIKFAKKVLNEDAGSEGLEYKLKAKSGLKALENDVVIIDEVKTEDDGVSARVRFAYPQDYGFALKTLQETFEGIEITSLSLVH